MLNFLFTKTPLLFFTQSFWRDEAFTAIMSKQSFLNIIVTTAKDFNPPLYYFLVHIWMSIFGSGEIALRSLSFLFYWGIIYIIYLFLIEVLKLSQKKSIIYILLCVINPFLLYYAFEARMYEMLAFLATLSYFALYTKRKKTYLVATVLGLYTHYFMVFVVLSQIIFLFFQKTKTLKKTFKLMMMPVLLFIPWILYVASQKPLIPQSFWIQNITLNTFGNLLGIVFTGYDNDFNFYNMTVTCLSLLLLGIIFAGVLKLRSSTKKTREFFNYCFLWGIGLPLFVALVSIVKPIFLPRYLIFSAIGLLILVIAALEQFAKPYRIVLLLILGLLSVHQLWMLTAYHKKSDYRRLYTEIKRLMQPKDAVYVTNELDFFTAEYYVDTQRVFIYGKSYEEIPKYVGKVLIAQSKMKSHLPLYPRKAFVVTSDSHYDIKSAF